MCGFVGFTGVAGDNTEIIRCMANKIIHRGPDSYGEYSDEHITLGFRRLSIIDLNEGSQPIYNEDKSIIIAFNGEIYNYKALRAMLGEKGHSFYTNSDTETIVHLYEEYGNQMFDYMRGMFAFVIYDKKSEALLAARDFFGIKPLYYSVQGGELVFGSEIKGLLEYPGFVKELNSQALEHYLSFQYSVLDETFFKGVYKLPPGHYLTFTCGEVKLTRYFQAEFSPDNSLDMEAAAREIDAAVLDSITMHKVSDVEVGSFLSSGVDSSYVAATFNGDKTFTVGFDYDKYNEISYAESLSQQVGIQNYNKCISTDEYWDILPKVMYHMDEPLADPSAVALYFVSELASSHVKVALSGEGADEFFGGYNIYKEPMDIKIITGLPMWLRRLLGKAASLLPFELKGKNFFIRGSKTIEERFIGNASIFTKKERERILKQSAGMPLPMEITKPYYEMSKKYDDITKMQFLDIHMWMVGDILLKADKMSMAHSLEVRVPYLDKEVFKTASRIPTHLRVSKSGTKQAFRRAALRHVPANVAEKKKLGFPVPIRIWLKDEKYYKRIKEIFSSEAAVKFFNVDKLIALLDTHYLGKRDLSRKIWTIYIFLIWYGEYFA